MFHLILNFSVIIFICYAVGGAAKAILFGSKKRQPAHRARAARPVSAPNRVRRKAVILPFPAAKAAKKAPRRNMRAA